MDLKKLNRMPVVLTMALVMVLVVSFSALAAPSEQGEQNGRGNDKKEAEQQPTSEPTPSGNGGQGCDGSHGSDTGHGANTDGDDNAYHNTCDGRASDNGNDDGGAGGRPCAGCVGNADDKNPPGQAPDDTDSNNGYECDGNNGVGGKKSNPAPSGNPAHTGCPIPPTDVCTVNCGPPPTCPPGSTDAACVPPTSTCPGGQQMLPNGKCNENKPPKLCPDGTPMPPDGTCVRGIIIEKEKNPSFPPVVRNRRVVAAPEPEVAPGAVLPFTGGDLMPVVTLALVLMAVGVLTLRRPATAGLPEGSGEPAPKTTSGATVQLPSGKRFVLPLRRVL